jgi:hypothetical protein
MSGERILVITPSRGRPDRLGYMLGETLGLSGPGTHVAVCTDNDDPHLDGYDELAARARQDWPDRVFWHRGNRRNLASWTNYVVAWPRAARYGYLASFGDDHVPRTEGWDEQLIAAIRAGGGTGIAYGDDKHQHEALPTAPVISRDITDALGWMILPGLRHMYCDNVWRVLSELAGCRFYVPEVVIEHVHPDAGKAGMDATYQEGYNAYPDDQLVFDNWQGSGAVMRDVKRVKGAMYHAYVARSS